jgi:hypothetical protein
MSIAIFPYAKFRASPTLLRWAVGLVPALSAPAASFAEFVAWPDRDVVVLVEVTPSVTLSNFTAVGGATPNTYKVALPRFIQEAGFAGGIYRKAVGVRENATNLTERADLASVDANPGSWWWDAANGWLYVRSTTGSDPDLFTAYQAFVTFYFATRGLVLNQSDAVASTGVYYHPWVTGDLPRLSMHMEDMLFGAKITETGNVTFTNGHGFWNTLVATNGVYNWKNKRMRFFLGGSYQGRVLPRSQYAAMITMLVEDVAADEQHCTFTLKPLAKQLDLDLPPTPYFESSYPNLGDGVRGTRKWIGYGRTTMRPDLTDTTSHGIWTIADAAFQTLYAVHQVQAIAKTTGVRSTLSLGTHYSVDLTACTLTIVSATYRWQDYDLEVDVTGKPVAGGGDYMKTFGAIVKDLLTTHVGVAAADLDTAAFNQADVDAPEELSFWIKSPRSLASLMSSAEAGFPSLERSVMGTLIQTLAGLWTCWIWDPGYDVDSVVKLRKEDFKSFRPQPKLETVFSTTRVHFNYNHARGEWPIERASSAKVEYLSETKEPLDVYTFLRGAVDAQTLAQRYQFISGSVSLEVEFEERGSKLAQELAGNKVLVTYDPAPDAEGSFTNKPFELLRIDRGMAPTLFVAGRFGDLRGVKDVGRWTADDAPTWAASDFSQREAQGYWTDDDGFADPADASSKNASIWW